MGALFNKMMSYSPEQYYPFIDPFVSTTLTNYGNGGQTSWSRTLPNPELEQVGPNGEGAWKFYTGAGSGNYTSFRIISAGGTGTNVIVTPEINDADYSSGFWFKIPVELDGLAGMNVTLLGRIGGEAPPTSVVLNLRGLTIGKLGLIGSASGSTFNTPDRYDDNQWHYYAERLYLNEGQLVKEHYLDGVLILSGNVIDNNGLNYFQLSNNFINSDTTNLTHIYLSHSYITPSSVIGSNEIAEIWAAGFAEPEPEPTVYDVKHYNGTEWEASTGQKYYDGNDWVDWNNVSEPKRWDGTQWIDLS